MIIHPGSYVSVQYYISVQLQPHLLYLIMLGCKTNLISVLYRETAYYWLRLCSR